MKEINAANFYEYSPFGERHFKLRLKSGEHQTLTEAELYGMLKRGELTLVFRQDEEISYQVFAEIFCEIFGRQNNWSEGIEHSTFYTVQHPEGVSRLNGVAEHPQFGFKVTTRNCQSMGVATGAEKRIVVTDAEVLNEAVSRVVVSG